MSRIRMRANRNEPRMYCNELKKADNRKKLLKSALYEHCRWHFAIDCIALKKIKLSNGELTPDTLAFITREYQVARNLKGGKGNQLSLVDIFNSARVNWPRRFSDRADKCAEIAEEIKDRKLSSKNQHPASAVTKVMWFLKPAEWTLYDRYVRQAFNIKGKNAKESMTKFYAALDANDFSDLARKFNRKIKPTSFRALNGARVLDKYMMMVGMDISNREKTMSDAEHFCASLPMEMKKELKALAQEICNLTSHRFLQGGNDSAK